MGNQEELKVGRLKSWKVSSLVGCKLARYNFQPLFFQPSIFNL